MFDEVTLKINLKCKILTGQLVVGQFGPKPTCSLVAVSHTLDKVSSSGSINYKKPSDN